MTIDPAQPEGAVLPETASPIDPLKRLPARHPLFFGADGLRSGWGLLIYIALVAALLYAANPIASMLRHRTAAAATHTGSSHELSPRSSMLGESAPLLAVAVATWIMARIERRPAQAYGFGGSHRLVRFFAGFGWGLAFLSLLVFALKSLGLLIFERRLLSGGGMVRDGAVWMVGFLLVALFEEYALRGYLQYTLARGLAGIFGALEVRYATMLGFWAAALLLSFVFGLGHGSNAGESPIGLLSAGAAGLVFCLSLWRTGSLWWAIGFHTAWDWAQSFLYGVADSGTMVQFHLFATHPAGRPILSGGATGPEGSIYILPVLALVTVTIVVTLPQRAKDRPAANEAHRS